MKRVFAILIICLCLIGCTKKERTLSDVLNEKKYIVLDVRTNEEYAEGHVKEAINIPYDEINSNIDLDKTKPILVYCKSGKRSSIARDVLSSLGYEVYDLGAYSTVTLEKE